MRTNIFLRMEQALSRDDADKKARVSREAGVGRAVAMVSLAVRQASSGASTSGGSFKASFVFFAGLSQFLTAWFRPRLALVTGLVLIGGVAEAQENKTKIAPAPVKPEITRIEPRGFQRGETIKLKVTGKGLDQVAELKLHHPKLTGRMLEEPAAKATEAWIELGASADMPRGATEISLAGKAGESARIRVFVDDLPQVHEADSGVAHGVERLPVSFWGVLETRGDVDEIAFAARAGQTIVFDLQARALGSKATGAMLTLLDERGRVLASNTGFDETGDPLIAHRFERTGRYVIRVSDLLLTASPDHFYRLSIGEFPQVTGVFPLTVQAGREAAIGLVGYNLRRGAAVMVRAEKTGDVAVPLDAVEHRSRQAFKVLATEGEERVEQEPNDTPGQAGRLPVPGAVNGRLLAASKGAAPDVDLYRFQAGAGQSLVLETLAARRGSPADTRIEVLHEDGRPVERLLLQAVRDSAVTFRPIDSVTVDVRVDNWEEMDLNEFLYMQGEVCKITRMPRGPDSGLNFFGNQGKRRTWFDTTATAHANEEPVYVVRPHPLGTRLVPNGLPVFTLHYVNDDDGERELGSDSRLMFTAPADGEYLVRVSDSKGFSGELFAYRLSVREASPDFQVTLAGTSPKVVPGNGTGFFFRVDRIDGFDGEVRMDVSGAPAGFGITTPIVIQRDQLEADGTIYAQPDAKAPAPEQVRSIQITATAMINGRKVVKQVEGFKGLTLAPAPKIFVKLEPDGIPSVATTNLLVSHPPREITIVPGETVAAWIRVERSGDTNLVNMDVDNLPHGVIVDNIGLNGVQVRAGEDEREIFLNARPWVEEQDRLIHAVVGSARAADGSAGKQTSFPVLLKVRKPASASTVSRR